MASVQTSRSVSGAHFLPFPHVEQNEKKQSLSALNIKKNIKELSAERFEEITSSPEWDAQTTIGSEAENVSAEVLDEADDRLLPESVEETVTPFSSEPTTFSAISSTSFAPVQSTESIIDKLDRVQSDLSLGVLSGEYPVLKEMSSSTTTTQLSTTVSEDDATTSKPFVLIRKFVPKSQRSTTAKPPRKPKTTKPSSTTESIRDGTQREDKKLTYDVQADELAALLPPGYKPRNSYKNKKPITTTQHPEVDENVDKVIEELVPKSRNLTTGRSYKAQATNQEIGPNLKPVKKNVQFKVSF